MCKYTLSQLYQRLFSSRLSPMCINLDSFISRFTYISLYYRNHQVDISEAKVYIYFFKCEHILTFFDF